MSKLEAWYMSDDIVDQKAPNRREPNEPVSPQQLAALGVKHWRLPPDAWNYPVKAFPFEPAEGERDPELQRLREEWGMSYADIITITPQHLPDCENKLKNFFEEHIHTDDEIRYILDGSGYFDYRDVADRWIRIHCKKGDLICLPEGSYHRFTLDEKEYIKAMRLFVGDPVWTPLNRPQDAHPSRSKYRARFVEAGVRQRICDIMRLYFDHGWCYGTSGGASTCVDPARREMGVVVTPSGVPKESLAPAQLFLVSADTGEVLASPDGGKLSDSTPVHAAIYRVRGARCGAVVHTHSRAANLVAATTDSKAFRITEQEMIKGLGLQNTEELVVPVVENRPQEPDLVPSIEAALVAFPDAVAVLVRSHGLYVWGPTLDRAKCHCECLEYLLDISIQRRLLGLSTLPPGEAVAPRRAEPNGEPQVKRPRRPRASEHAAAVVLDVEGTTTPISFVKDTLFGFFTREVAAWLERHRMEPAAAGALAEIRAQLRADGQDENRDPVEVLGEWVAQDRKCAALKGLQGIVWRDGYSGGMLRGAMFDDVPVAFEGWASQGKRIYIFSSGSREAQRLIYAHSDKGDLTRHLAGYFEPASVGGHSKQAPEAYQQIALTLGKPPQDLVFATDILGEAEAARAAGWQAVLVVRPGNAPLPPGLSFPTVTSLLDL